VIPTPSKKWRIGSALTLAIAAAISIADAAPIEVIPAKPPMATVRPGDPAPMPKPRTASGLTADQIVRELARSLESDMPEVDLGPDPLGALAEKITSIHSDLSQFKTDKPVQEKQDQVVSTLDALIAKLQPPGGGSGGGNNPSGTGRKKSSVVGGEAKIGDLHGVDPRARQWSQLPPKERDRILQSRTEGFPAGYEALLQSYYQRLAQEKAAEEKPLDGGAAPKPPATPAPKP
jgi:hypothetical protein